MRFPHGHIIKIEDSDETAIIGRIEIRWDNGVRSDAIAMAIIHDAADTAVPQGTRVELPLTFSKAQELIDALEEAKSGLATK